MQTMQIGSKWAGLRWRGTGKSESDPLLDTHICWKVPRDADIDPPIQTLCLLVRGVTTLIFMLLGAKAVTSLFTLPAILENMVESSLSAMFPYKSFLISMSRFIMNCRQFHEFRLFSFRSEMVGGKTSGQRDLSTPIVIACLSGNSWFSSTTKQPWTISNSCSQSVQHKRASPSLSQAICRSTVGVKENPVSGRVLIRVSIRFRPTIPSRKIMLFLKPWASCENIALGEDALKLNTHPGSCSSDDDGLHASPRQHQQNLGLFSNAAKRSQPNPLQSV